MTDPAAKAKKQTRRSIYIVSDSNRDVLVEARSPNAAAARMGHGFTARLAAQGEITHLRYVCGRDVIDAEANNGE